MPNDEPMDDLITGQPSEDDHRLREVGNFVERHRAAGFHLVSRSGDVCDASGMYECIICGRQIFIPSPASNYRFPPCPTCNHRCVGWKPL